MISLLLFAIAALLDAFIDTLEEGHFQTSIFSKMNQNFWYKEESWKTARKIGGYPIDAWHLGKSAMIVAVGFAITQYDTILNPTLDVVLYGVAWITVFNWGYNHLFKRKT
jgi:hypothetical protein